MRRTTLTSLLILLSFSNLAVEDAAKPQTTIPSIQVSERPLQQVVDYLSRVGDVTITLRNDDLKKLLIKTEDTSELKNVTWRAVLEVVCRKHKLRIDESRIKEKLVIVYRPERITMNFKNADVREVLWAIAQSGKLNVVIDPDVKGNVTATLNDVACDEALGVIARTLGFEVVVEKTGGIKVQ